MAMLESLAHNKRAEVAAFAQMAAWYRKAETRARDNNDPNLYYPALNRIAAEVLTNFGRPDWTGLDETTLIPVRQNLAVTNSANPDFWNVTSTIDLRVYEALAKRHLAAEVTDIEAAYRDVHERVSQPWLWASVHDQFRLVLPAYQIKASSDEKTAVARLLALVEAMAKD